MLPSWKTTLTTTISIITLRSSSVFSLKETIIQIKLNFHIVLVFDLIRLLILPHSSSHFFITSFLLSVGTSVKYLIPLMFSKYSFVLPIIRYKGFTLLIVTYFNSLIITYDSFDHFNFTWIKFYYIDNLRKNSVCGFLYLHLYIYYPF